MAGAGYSSRCKACNSPLRTQIEQWHEDGQSSRVISAKLKERGEKISDRALDNHFDEHYNVQDVAREQYQQSQVNIEADAQALVSDIKILDNVVSGKYQLHQKLEKILNSLLPEIADKKGPNHAELTKIPTVYVTLYNGCAAEIRQALKAKQELLGEDGNSKKAGAMQSWVDMMLEDE